MLVDLNNMFKDSLIMFPLQSEFTYFCQHLKSYGFSSIEKHLVSIPIKIFSDLNLVCAVGGHGKVQFGIQTQYLIHHYSHISKVFCIGAAGGISKVKTFDIVVAEKTIEHDYKEKFDPEPLPSFSACDQTLNYMKSKLAKHDFPFGIHFGFIASGDEDVVSVVRANEIHRDTNALAVAWEGAGGARASSFNRRSFVEIRGITDVADSQAPIHFQENLNKVMKNIVDVCVELID